MSVLCIDNMAFNKLYKKHTSQFWRWKKCIKICERHINSQQDIKQQIKKQDTIMLIVLKDDTIYLYTSITSTCSHSQIHQNKHL
jgi:hypothetical protein